MSHESPRLEDYSEGGADAGRLGLTVQSRVYQTEMEAKIIAECKRSGGVGRRRRRPARAGGNRYAARVRIPDPGTGCSCVEPALASPPLPPLDTLLLARNSSPTPASAMRRDVRILLVGDGASHFVSRALCGAAHECWARVARRWRREEHHSHLPHQRILRAARASISLARLVAPFTPGERPNPFFPHRSSTSSQKSLFRQRSPRRM